MYHTAIYFSVFVYFKANILDFCENKSILLFVAKYRSLQGHGGCKPDNRTQQTEQRTSRGRSALFKVGSCARGNWNKVKGPYNCIDSGALG